MITQQLRSKEHIIIQHYNQPLPSEDFDVVKDHISLKTDVQVQDTCALKTDNSVSLNSGLENESNVIGVKACILSFLFLISNYKL